MNKRKGLRLGGCFAGAIILVIILYLISDKVNSHKNDFHRIVDNKAIFPMDTLNIGFNSYYIAGFSPHRIYFGNYTAPIYVLTSDLQLNDTKHFQVKVPYYKELNGEGLKLTIDSPVIFLIDRISTYFLYGTIGDSLDLQGKVSQTQFSKSLPISPNSVVIKVFNKPLKQDILQKWSTNTPISKQAFYPLGKQQEGTFSPDGMINYDRKTGELVYVYFYRNQFVVLDTNMNPLYKGKTIDTTASAHLMVSNITSQGVSSLSAPPLTVNKRSAINEDYLFVNSLLMADNENKSEFNKSSVIDVYTLKNGSYRCSFYLPEFHKEKISDFSVYGKTLFVFYGRYLISYKLKI